jgi:site-specific DNA recombinase
MARAAIYARVSSSRQKEEQTIASQTAALQAYAVDAELEVSAEWVFEDDGYSGATLVRPALERLRDLVAEGEVPVVLCYAPDRLARRYAYQVLVLEEFARVGTPVHFLKGGAGGTPEEELLVQFQGMIAEYEKAQITERTRRGKLHRARAGSVAVLSTAPYGYRYIPKQDGMPARYDLMAHEATVVREVFRLYGEDGHSLNAVARELSRQGIPTASGKRPWTASALRYMLRNPAYCGRAGYGKTQALPAAPGRRGRRGRVVRATMRERPRSEWIEIPVPMVVSEDQFAQAARRLDLNKQFATRRTRTPTLLQGLLVCESCGYHFYRTTWHPRRTYYRCRGADRYRFPDGPVCHNRPVRQDHLDALVWDQVTALLAEPARVRAELDRRVQALQAVLPSTMQRQQLEHEQRRLTRVITRLLQAYQDELLSLDELRERLPAVRQRQVGLQAQLRAVDVQQLDRDTYLHLAESLESFLTRLRTNADYSTIADRQRVVRLVVREVLVGPDRITVRHTLPTPRSDPTPSCHLRTRRVRAFRRREFIRRQVKRLSSYQPRLASVVE